MRDPVSGFEYPDAWITSLSADARADVAGGLSVLTADGTILHRGFTTGTTAAAAAKASVISLIRPVTDGVSIMTPAGIRIFVKSQGDTGQGECKKFSGDYPGDVTSGLCFSADATPAEKGISISTGTGIGIWGRDNPRYPKGTPAISPPARLEIYLAIEEACTEAGIPGVEVCISSKDGERIAEKTLNATIGVFGGISILGSTGFVEPWDDHLEESVCGQVSLAKNPVITTGRIGLRFARLLYPEHEVILVGGKIGEALDAANGAVILCGLPALILRYINPHILDGTGFATVEEFSVSPLFRPVMQETLAGFRRERPAVQVVLIDRNGTVIGESP